MHRAIEIPDNIQDLNGLAEETGRTGQRLVICRNGEPVAALISLTDLCKLEQEEQNVPSQPAGLAGLVGAWPGFEEIDPFIQDAVDQRELEQPRPFELD